MVGDDYYAWHYQMGFGVRVLVVRGRVRSFHGRWDILGDLLGGESEKVNVPSKGRAHAMETVMFEIYWRMAVALKAGGEMLGCFSLQTSATTY